MRRELSTRFLLTFSVCLAVAAAMFCWRWSSRCSSQVDSYKREVLAFEAKQEELEHQMLGIAALLVKTAGSPSETGRILPSHPGVAEHCRDIFSSPVLQSIEAARADLFLLWYYEKLRRDYAGSS